MITVLDQEQCNAIKAAPEDPEAVSYTHLLKTLGAGDYFWFVAPLYFFLAVSYTHLDVYKRQGQQLETTAKTA